MGLGGTGSFEGMRSYAVFCAESAADVCAQPCNSLGWTVKAICVRLTGVAASVALVRDFWTPLFCCSLRSSLQQAPPRSQAISSAPT